MKKLQIIQDGKVLNTALIEDDCVVGAFDPAQHENPKKVYTPPEGCVAVEDDAAAPGWTYDGQSFFPPPKEEKNALDAYKP